MKRLIALLMIVLSVVLLLTSCGGTVTPEAGGEDVPDTSPAGDQGKKRPTTGGKAENTVTTAMGDIPTTFDPEHYALAVEDNVIIQVYEPLFMQTLDGGIDLYLAEEMVTNDDGSVSIKLRDAKFHSGETVTSEDVVYSFSRLETSTMSSAIYGLIDFEIEDDTHFTMKFPYADQGAGFDALISYIPNVMIENKSWAEAKISDPNDNLGLDEDGTGAYYFESMSDGYDITLKRFDDYWGDVSVDTIKIKHLSGDLEIAFEAGDLDFVGVSASRAPAIEVYENADVSEIATTSVTFLIIGCNEALPTGDIKVRQAIAYALNRQDIADAASESAGKLAFNIAPPTVKYYTEDVERFDRDLEKSKELLTEAGYSESNKVSIEIITIGAQTPWVSACELVKANLEESYFTVDITQVEDTSRYFQTDYEMGIITLGYTTDFSMYNVLFVPDSGLDLAGYTDTAILDTFAAISDEASTQKAMRDAVDTVAYYPLFYPVSYYASDSDLDLGSSFGTYNMLILYKDFSWK